MLKSISLILTKAQMYHSYISISPILSDNELNIFKLFNDLCEFNMELKQPQGYSIWFHDRKGSLKDGFEIIHPKKTSQQLIDDFNTAFEKLSNYSTSSYFKENLDIVMNYQSIFVRTNLTHKHSFNYQFSVESGEKLSHLIKIINIFHEDGFLKKFLALNTQSHDFSQVVTNSQSHESFIIEKSDIYTAELLPTGYYTRKEKISYKWCEELLDAIEKKSLQDKLQLSLQEKQQNIIQKI